MNEPQTSVWFRLLWMFLKVNVLSPSGPASVGFLYEEAVGKIMTEERFVEAVGFSNVLPGSEALKLAMFVGFSAGGLPGVFAALLGAILPPTVLMLIVARKLDHGLCGRNEPCRFRVDCCGIVGVVPRRLTQKNRSPRSVDRRVKRGRVLV
jgi:hypothetical protein